MKDDVEDDDDVEEDKDENAEFEVVDGKVEDDDVEKEVIMLRKKRWKMMMLRKMRWRRRILKMMILLKERKMMIANIVIWRKKMIIKRRRADPKTEIQNLRESALSKCKWICPKHHFKRKNIKKMPHSRIGTIILYEFAASKKPLILQNKNHIIQEFIIIGKRPQPKPAPHIYIYIYISLSLSPSLSIYNLLLYMFKLIIIPSP